MFNEIDKKFMQLALEEANLAKETKDHPIGAALVINGKIIDSTYNKITSSKKWINHAENQLIIKHSELIKESHKQKQTIAIYTTLEPCIQCLGAAAMHRVSNIVYGCPDPYGGAASLKPDKPFLIEIWPKLEGSLMEKECGTLLIEHMQKNITSWEQVLPYFLKLQEKWKE